MWCYAFVVLFLLCGLDVFAIIIILIVVVEVILPAGVVRNNVLIVFGLTVHSQYSPNLALKKKSKPSKGQPKLSNNYKNQFHQTSLEGRYA